MKKVFNKTWTEFKAKIDKYYLPFEYEQSLNKYLLYMPNGDFEYTCTILIEDPAGDDQADFEANYKSTAGHPDHLRSEEGMVYTAADKPDYTRHTLVTHDLADKTTWFQSSTKVQGLTLSTTDGITFSDAEYHCWVDADATTDRDLFASQKATDGIVRRSGMRHKFYKVYKNGVLQDDSAYTIDSSTGIVTFNPSIDISDVVKADFYKAGGADWVVAPPAGKKYEIYRAEIQFSKDADLASGISFLIKAGPYTVFEKTYFSMQDYLNTSNLAYVMPAAGGLVQDVVILPWDYATKVVLKSSQNMSLTVSLEGDEPITNTEIATATLYIYERDE